MVKIGNINELIVKRETDIAYTLYDENDQNTEYFLHFNQTTRKLKVGEKIKVFLYYDNKKRLCATMEEPIVTTEKIGFGKVVTINPQAGCFMNIGTVKDILLSSDDLPINKLGWPCENDMLPIILKVKKNSIVARIISKDDVKNNAVENIDKKTYNVKDEVECTVSAFSQNGIICWTDDLEYVYINKNLTRKKYHLGERIKVHLIGRNEFGDLLASQIEQKEKMRLNDSETIMNYLDKLGGVMPLGNNSTPEEINKLLNMSKSAFKRAIGNLYKYHKIIIEDKRILKIENE